ncbi:hypothetical protein HK100_000929 [Physocladia obscura]|uniref:non-specific serine/threonine protein kinase n=1 Tax=Physocladia obscura TaxID=109957 RepID=A0AAD5SXJ5_9FUNG|nr:hypothetical protein HK100_000929 [Physocladia obscura]
MRYAFQDDENLLMVFDLKLGGDLRFHLSYKGLFTEDRTRFYVAQVSSALNYLHNASIAHRDVKPDNILLDENGNASLTDFNVARHYTIESPMTSRAGTARYMAPEVVRKSEYNYDIDWWSLGISTFEMMYGHTPFQSKDKTILDIQILNGPIVFPLEDTAKRIPFLSKDAHDFILGLLSRIPTERIGSHEMGGYSQFQKHAWFEGLDWNLLEKRELVAPFIPDVEKQSYHDPRYNLEEFFTGRTDLSSKPVVNGGSLASRRRRDHSRPPYPPPPAETKSADNSTPHTIRHHHHHLPPPPILPPSIAPPVAPPDFQQLRKMYLEGMEKTRGSSSTPASVNNSVATAVAADESGAIGGGSGTAGGATARRNGNKSSDAATRKISSYHLIFDDRVGLVRQSHEEPRMMTEQEEFQLHLLETEFRIQLQLMKPDKTGVDRTQVQAMSM